MIINFNPKHGAEYYGTEQTFRFTYGAPAVEYVLITLSHGYPLNITLSHDASVNVTLTQGYPVNITLSQEVA